MRILFTTIAEKSHVLTMAPLAWALTTAGHEVRMASDPGMADVITSAGLTAVSVGTDNKMHEMLQQQDNVEHELADWSEPFIDKQNWAELLLKFQVGVEYGFQLYNDAIVDDLVAYTRSWRPDLVIWDPVTYAGAVAARVSGAAHARLMWCLDIYSTMWDVLRKLNEQQPAEERHDPLASWLGARLDTYGLDFHEEVVLGQWTIDQIPGSVQLDLPVHRLPVRYTAYNGRSVVPDWVAEPPQRRRILLTPGASFAAAMGSTFVPLKESLEALADLDVEVVATLSAEEQAAVGTFPDNARVVEFVPLHSIMSSCSAVVHHGGFGTWSTSALYGVPQFMLPIRHSDMWIKAKRTQEFGAGLFSHPSEITADGLRDGVIRLIDEPEFAAGAAKLRQEMMETATPNDIVPELERLTAQHRR